MSKRPVLVLGLLLGGTETALKYTAPYRFQTAQTRAPSVQWKTWAHLARILSLLIVADKVRQTSNEEL